MPGELRIGGNGMEFLLVCVGVGAVAYFVCRGPAKQLKMGHHLTQMTNILERLEQTRGGDNLPAAEFARVERQFEESIAYLKTYPPEVVTRELAKNAELAARMGRPRRAATIEKLIERLAWSGVTLHLHDYMLDQRLAELQNR